MTDRPMIFSAPMVQALLDRRKTQTRRLLEPQPPEGHQLVGIYAPGLTAVFNPAGRGSRFNADQDVYVRLPSIGDCIWVKEAWNTFTFSQDGECAWPTDTIPTREEMRDLQAEAYRYDTQVVYRESDRARKWFQDATWRSPIFMPKWASRLTLTVTDVRVQRVQEITEADARAEGVDPPMAEVDTPAGPMLCPYLGGSYVDAFRDLWDSIHGPDTWDRNDWVAAITFDVHKRNIMEVGG